jgi:hypothetical protein
VGSSINSFGRLVAPKDARDLNFRMVTARAQIIDEIGKPKPRKRAYQDGPLLDQGQTPQCVGYSTRGFLDGAPIMSKPNEGPSATTIYKMAQDNDEWPGNNYDGTSVRGAMKALQKAGQISSYVWGQTVEHAIAWMNDGYGTCLVGTNWYAEMSDVDSDGFMREPPTSLSTPIGGHAWRWIWYDPVKKGILMRNSWGHDFGFIKKGQPSGYAYLRTQFAIRLLEEDGEIAAPTQVKITPVAVAA